MHDFREDGDAVVIETMTIFPDASEVKEVAKLLLELADNPRQVATTLDPSIGFVVPLWLYETFVATWSVKLNAGFQDGGDVVPATEVVVEALEVIETPARRKPGRPRKES
jgi:hypothetical protein